MKENQSVDDLKSYEIDEQFIKKNMLQSSESHNYDEEVERADEICPLDGKMMNHGTHTVKTTLGLKNNMTSY